MSRGAWERPYTEQDQRDDEDALWMPSGTLDDDEEQEAPPAREAVQVDDAPVSEGQARREACGCDQCLFGGRCVSALVCDPAELVAGQPERSVA